MLSVSVMTVAVSHPFLYEDHFKNGYEISHYQMIPLNL